VVRKLDLLNSVGKFDNVVAGAQLPFSRLTVIHAENARGKTTLASVLRSLASGRADLVTERARLGAPNRPHIVIDTGHGAPAVFQNGAWSRTAPEISVFDDNFVAENVCSGIEVGATHRQNLHELIIGSQGIVLARALQAEVDRIEDHNRNLRAHEAAIPAQIRGNLSVDTFCALSMVADLPRLIEEAARRLAAARDAGRVAETPVFPALTLPRIDIDALRALLAKGLPDLDAGALARVQEHLRRLGREGESWVGEGMKLADHLTGQEYNECPFCAQNLGASPILGHYRAYFGEAYNGLKREITDAIQNFRDAQASDVPAAFERSVREAVERQTFWKALADVPAVEIDTAAIARIWKLAREHVGRLLEAKSAAPLDVLVVPQDIERAIAEHNAQCDRLFETSEQLAVANQRLETVKEQAREANIATLASDLANLQAVQARHDPAIAPLCDAYLTEKAAKMATELRRDAARTALDRHRQTAFPAYGISINDFLLRFNASFRVGPVDAVNTRGGSTANYTLLIEGNAVPLSGNPGTPSFRNTLSAGDRNTLALAFFFASLINDPQRGQKVIVFDDPMTSLDEHRTLHTLQEIDRLAKEVAVVIVLSHSKPFLLGVWDKCRQLAKTALAVQRSGTGSTLAAWNVNADMVDEHDRRYALAESYLQQADPTVERRVAESLRPMLERFCRVAYPVLFTPGTMLGGFHRQCLQRLGTPQEIMSEVNVRELRDLLDYGNRFHHDTNPAYATEIINDATLSDFTRRTLAFIRRP
jgi:wobble nucleotide-excising tRNase